MENPNQQTQPPQIPEVSAQILSVNNNSRKSKAIAVILGILAISIIAIGALALIIKQNQTVNQPIVASPTIPQPSPTPFPTTSQITPKQESSDVLTYRASSWSIGYPQGWTVQRDSKTGGIFFFEPQKKAFMSVQPAKLSEEELNKVSSKEKLKEFMLQVYGITGITYVREENSPLMDNNEIRISMRLITKQKDFDGISDILLTKDTIYGVDFFVKTTLPDEEEKSLRSFYNEKILLTFVGE